MIIYLFFSRFVKRREEHGIASIYDDKYEKEYKRNEQGEILFRYDFD